MTAVTTQKQFEDAAHPPRHTRAELLAQLAESEFRRARQIDAQQDSQPGFEDFTLIDARA